MIRLLLMGSKKRIKVRSPVCWQRTGGQESGVRRLFFIFCFMTSVFYSSTTAFAVAITGRVEVVGQYGITPRKGLEERIRAERSLVVDKDGGLKNAVVLIRGIKGSNSSLNGPFVINQKNKTFLPHVLAIMVGTTVMFKNEDPFVFPAARVEAKWGTTHNVHCMTDEMLLEYITDEKKTKNRISKDLIEKYKKGFTAMARMDENF